MDDREKVLDVDDYCLRTPKTCDRDACPYYDFRDECLDKWFSDALKVLKTQEPVKPIIKHEMDDVCSCIDNVAYCGKCGEPIGRLKKNYCSNCGQEVKWDA